MSRPNSWFSLPNEMKLAILESLDLHDAKSFARIDKSAYAIAVPVLFTTVNLVSLDALLNFLRSVPPSYFHYIRHLHVSTLPKDLVPDSSCPATDALTTLLTASTNLHHLHIDLANSLAHSIIPAFAHLSNLKHLSIVNVGDDVNAPISERLVVAIAATIPALEHLHLDRISRSRIHAPDLTDAYPPVPLVVSGDDAIPDHPLLGSNLSLPSLLRLPSLRSLTIHDTHLGDPLWSTTRPSSKLTSLDLGCYPHTSPSANSLFSHRILATVAPSLKSLTLASSLDSTPLPSLPTLQHLRFTAFLPPDALSATAEALATSPITRLSVDAFPDDFVDTCTALSDILALRVDRGPSSPFLPSLAHIDVTLVPLPAPDAPPPTNPLPLTRTTPDINDITTTPDPSSSKPEDAHEHAAAARMLRDFCHDLSLASTLTDLTGTPLVPVDDDDDDDNASEPESRAFTTSIDRSRSGIGGAGCHIQPVLPVQLYPAVTMVVAVTTALNSGSIQ